MGEQAVVRELRRRRDIAAATAGLPPDVRRDMEEAGRRQAADTAAALARVARRSALLDHAHDAARDGDYRRAAELVEQAQQLDPTRREQLDELLTSFREQAASPAVDAERAAAPAEPTEPEPSPLSSPVTLSPPPPSPPVPLNRLRESPPGRRVNSSMESSRLPCRASPAWCWRATGRCGSGV